ncbi:Universal stress protein A-like protein [Acorus calamus]|uniref:Universal stress protein A-like protein n=1 Tax=Acorus calamus TaxID=4465 RepID=A0AAV9CKT1_ACOCL|nr:Universal stress protein A-like protein [Acorus calamus]
MEAKQSEGEGSGSVEFSEKGEEDSNMSSESGGSGSRHSMGSGKMKVVVALDQSEGSFDALRWALRHLFSDPSGKSVAGSILLVHVQEPFHTYVYPVGPAYMTSPVMQSVKKAQQMNAELLFAKALPQEHLTMGEGLDNVIQVEVDTVVLEGDPKEMICQAAEEHGAALLLVGSRGLGNIERVFLGSVSDYCAHHAKCPIVIVKPHTL